MATPDHNMWLGTNSGKVIDLLNPDPEQIDLADICEALPKICRFNGQINIHYSVAEHSMYVASLVPDKLKYQAILHDAAEAYICDIPTPLKRYLGKIYTDLEEKLNLAIGQKLGVDIVNLHSQVKQADAIVTISERDKMVFVPQYWGEEYEMNLRFPFFEPAGYITPEDFRGYIEQYKELAERTT